MRIAADVAITILLFLGFGFIHTVLASKKAKLLVKAYFGNLIALYRLFYNIVSLVLLLFIFDAAPKPPVVLYDLPVPYDLIVYFLQVLSLAAVVYTFSIFDFKEFLGVSQAIRWFNGEYDASELDEKSEFKVEKVYKYMRHPGYFFTFLFLGLRPQMDAFYFTAFVCFSCYFYIGSFYEEKKLVDKFGSAYLEYQERVPRFFPFNFFGK